MAMPLPHTRTIAISLKKSDSGKTTTVVDLTVELHHAARKTVLLKYKFSSSFCFFYFYRLVKKRIKGAFILFV
jgi:hypothetical protein